MALHVLVTGGAGYLGAILCEHLLKAGHTVTVLDNLLYNQRSLFHFCSNPNFDFYRGDVREKKLLGNLLKKADVIIPLAAIVGASACDKNPWEAVSINVDSMKLLKKLRSQEQLIIYPTTNSGYGTQSGEVFCTEETPLEPITLYGKTKVQAEQEILDSPNTITLRLATVFGFSPRFRLDLLVNHFTFTAFFDRYLIIFEKDFKRNYVHIRDVADCFLFAIENQKKMIGKAFNVGLDSVNLSKAELACKVKAFVPDFYIHYAELGSDPDKRNYIVSNERLKKVGFEAKISLEDGIRELLKGYRMLGRQAFKNS